MADMAPDRRERFAHMLRGQGYLTLPEIVQRETRPVEVVTMGGEPRRFRLYVPPPPVHTILGVTRDWGGFDDVAVFDAHEYAVRVWFTERVETEDADMEAPRIILYGYWRVWRSYIWRQEE